MSKGLETHLMIKFKHLITIHEIITNNLFLMSFLRQALSFLNFCAKIQGSEFLSSTMCLQSVSLISQNADAMIFSMFVMCEMSTEELFFLKVDFLCLSLCSFCLIAFDNTYNQSDHVVLFVKIK